MGLFSDRTVEMVSRDAALPGRLEPVEIVDKHFVLGNSLTPPFPDGYEIAIFAMGCFWGAERRMWQADGVWTTAAGYCGGYTANPTYEEVCTGRTGHAESVLVVFNPNDTSFVNLVRLFFESHDPTQRFRQGNDVGTQYRSAIYASDGSQLLAAGYVADAYNSALKANGHGLIQTEIIRAGPFYYGEPYHQQYLAKNPDGYCGLGGTGINCPTGIGN